MKLREEYRTGLLRAGVAAVFTFGLFVMKAGGTGGDGIDAAQLYDAGYAALAAAAPFLVFGASDARRNDKAAL